MGEISGIPPRERGCLVGRAVLESERQETGTDPTPASKGKRFPAGRLFTGPHGAAHGRRSGTDRIAIFGAAPRRRRLEVGGRGDSEKTCWLGRWLDSEFSETANFPSRRIFRVGSVPRSGRLAIRPTMAAARRSGGALRRCAARRPRATGLWRPASAAGLFGSESAIRVDLLADS